MPRKVQTIQTQWEKQVYVNAQHRTLLPIVQRHFPSADRPTPLLRDVSPVGKLRTIHTLEPGAPCSHLSVIQCQQPSHHQLPNETHFHWRHKWHCLAMCMGSSLYKAHAIRSPLFFHPCSEGAFYAHTPNPSKVFGWDLLGAVIFVAFLGPWITAKS